MALSPNVPVVNPGELITSAHINNIRSNLDRLDTTKVLKAGDTMTGQLNLGAAPSPTQTGLALRTDGPILNNVNGTVSTNNILMRRIGGSAVAFGIFVEFRIGAADTQIGAIAINSGLNGVSYNTTSDGRLKDDLGPVVDPLDVIERLRPRHLRWKSNGAEFDGFIAQEVADVAPQAVTGDEETNPDPTVNPIMFAASELVPYLVGAIQTLSARVQALEAVTS
jgi:hypothetical protein